MLAHLLRRFGLRRPAPSKAAAVVVEPPREPLSAEQRARRQAEVLARVQQVELETARDSGRADAIAELTRRRCRIAFDRGDPRGDEIRVANGPNDDQPDGIWL